ncbi:MAG: DsrE family protein [Trichloromonas sp.]|jgi:predicted peroxiredoxin|nr:DsrE family protein [Trichloromonas sp.]
MKSCLPKKTSFIALLATLTLLFSAGHALAKTDRWLVMLTSGDTQTQGMAMVLATEAQRQGTPVRMLLCGDAGKLALKDFTPTALKPREVTPKQMLQGLMQNGAQVQVCALFLPNAGKTAEDLIDGVSAATPPEIVNQLNDDDTRVLSF